MPHPPKVMGVAVSGGSDSMALLHLLQEFCQLHCIELHAVTVNHNLRDEAADEAAYVSGHCARLGVPHDTLLWEDWSGRGNLQSAARNARYSKMADWAAQYDISTIAVGHTADDQAETVLMGMSRRSGVDGLSGMSSRTVRDGITWVRPLLHTRRDTLQKYLEDNKITWVDDPSNDNDDFDRIKARKALGMLADLGIGVDVLSQVADHLGEARRALDWQTFLTAKQIVSFEAGAIVIEETGLRLQPDEIQRRLLVRALSWVSGTPYPPRRAAIAHVLKALKQGQAGTLHGCHIRRIGAQIWVFREANAVLGKSCPIDEIWDNRWQMRPATPESLDTELVVTALGFDGLEKCADWRATGRPHVVLQSSPAVWRGDELISAPLAGFENNWTSDLVTGPDTFFAALLSH